MRTFRLPNDAGEVVFSESALGHMYECAQRRLYSKEAGGQLFSPNPHHGAVSITHATGPYRQDKRSRTKFIMEEGQANIDRYAHFQQGRHAVGLWHTHPETTPRPSTQDEQTTRLYLKSFEGSMDGFLLVIIGNSGFPPSMSVWLASTNSFNSWIELKE